MKKEEYFHRMAAVEIFYTEDNEQKSRKMNAIILSKVNTIDKINLDDCRKACLERLFHENGVDPSVVDDFVFLALAPLGKQTQDDFQGKPSH